MRTWVREMDEDESNLWGPFGTCFYSIESVDNEVG